MTPLNPRTVLVTGATDGLGRALAERIAAGGDRVIVHGRDPGRIERAVEEIRGTTGNDQLYPALADLAELAQVRALAESVLADHPDLDVLVSNAGIGTSGPGGRTREVSVDGYELRFAVNYLAGYLLTRLLLPRLRAAPSARIVQVSSAGQAPIDFDDVMLERNYSGIQAYCQSKLAQIMFTFDLADELAGTAVTATALHPATFMPTKIVTNPISTIEEGVEATYRLVAARELDGVTGQYFDGQRPAKAHPQAYDPDARKQLRELSDHLTGR
ncbi:MAG TPA: SDR family NAD(P)-dependent oxidoreductase [Jatrophihabitantaceae bacterium]|jgi:NAD(P)-dependent dehydrogenase (short-subunit alcohol dehydrogenase family)